MKIEKMKIEKITPKDFDVLHEDDGLSISVYNNKYRDAISFVQKHHEYFGNKIFESGDMIFLNLKERGYQRVTQSLLDHLNGYKESFGFLLNIFNESFDVSYNVYFTFTHDELFYDITDIVYEIKKAKYSKNNKANTDYIKLFKEIALISSYEFNKDMNPSKIAYNLGKINLLATNYLENIEN